MKNRYKNIQKFFRNFYKDSEFDFDLEKVEVSEFIFSKFAITLWKTNEWHAQISCMKKTKEKVTFIISCRDRTCNRDTEMFYYSFDEKGMIMEEKYKRRNDINVRINFFYDKKNRIINIKKYEYEDDFEKKMMYVDDMKKVLWRELHIFYEESFNFQKLDVFDTIGIKKEENYMIFCHSKGHALIDDNELKKINFYINN